jgi:hypothetical protein
MSDFALSFNLTTDTPQLILGLALIFLNPFLPGLNLILIGGFKAIRFLIDMVLHPPTLTLNEIIDCKGESQAYSQSRNHPGEETNEREGSGTLQI